MLLPVNEHSPRIGHKVFIADTARVTGQVVVGDGASIWYGAVVRGDFDRVDIGPNTNIQDNASVHAEAGWPVTIGRDVTVGHNAVIHGCTIGDGAMVGIGAIVLNGAHVGNGAVVAAGAVVPEGAVIPPGHLAVGVPARVIRELSPEQIARLKENADVYSRLAAVYADAQQ